MNPPTDSLVFEEQGPPKLNTTLNVLTILTIVGCSIGALFTLATPWLMSFSLKMLDKAAASAGDLSPQKMAEMRKGREAIELVQNNLVPLLAVGLIGLILCFVGALMMRKLKKDGYWLYIAGQVVPIAGSIIIVGTSQYQGATSFFVPLVQVVFIVLYTMQRKNLVY